LFLANIYDKIEDGKIIEDIILKFLLLILYLKILEGVTKNDVFKRN